MKSSKVIIIKYVLTVVFCAHFLRKRKFHRDSYTLFDKSRRRNMDTFISMHFGGLLDETQQVWHDKDPFRLKGRRCNVRPQSSRFVTYCSECGKSMKLGRYVAKVIPITFSLRPNSKINICRNGGHFESSSLKFH